MLPELNKELLKEAHDSTIFTHHGSTKMYNDLKRHFWWIGMQRHIADYVARCLTSQRVKTEHQKPLPIAVWKWEHITMDFIVGLPRTNKHHDAIWVIIDRLTKTYHFLALKITFTAEQLADLYINEVVRLYGIPLTIMSDHDSKFASNSGKDF